MPTLIDHPFHVDDLGRTATTTADDHLYDLIEQVLFTSPGERVMRPTFGSGLLRLVFEPASSELVSATQMFVQGSLQQWLGELIAVEGVVVDSDEGTLRVTVQYVIRRTKERRSDAFERKV
jgi:phage baseplate assembly protein W